MNEPLAKYPNPTFPLLNQRTGLIEIIDAVTGEVVAKQHTVEDFLVAKESRMVPLQLQDGTVVYVEKGASHLDLPSLGVSGSKYRYNHIVAEIICQKLAGGMTMTKLYREPGVPPAWVIRKWRAEHPEFDKAVKLAKTARAEFFHDKVIDTAHEMDESTVGVDKEKIKALQWAAQVGNPEEYGNKTKISGDPNAPLQFVIDTGIRRPGDPGYNEDATEKLKAQTDAATQGTRDVTPPEGRLPTGGGEKVPRNETDDPGDHGT